MKTVSREFKKIAYSLVKTGFRAWIELDGVEIETLIEWSLLHELNFASTAMAQANITLKGEHDLLDKEIMLYYGYEIEGGLESIGFGPFKIIELAYDAKLDRTSAIGFDKMLELCQTFDVSGVEFPITIKELIEHIGAKVGVPTQITGNDFVIDVDRYTGTGHEYRSFLEDVAEFNNEVFFFNNGILMNKKTEETDVFLHRTRMRQYSFTTPFGPVDSLVLSRQPSEDNVYSSNNPEDVLSEVKFNDNYLVDYDREGYVDALFAKYEGLVVRPFEIITNGLGFIDLADFIKVNVDEVVKDLLVYGISLKASTSLRETLFCSDPLKTTTKYQYGTDSERKSKQTEIIVDKQTGEIKQIVNDVEYLGEEVSEQGSHIRQTKDELYSEIVERKNQGDEILEETRANTSLLKDEFTLEFTRIDGSLDEVTGDLNEWKTTYQLNEDGATIGKNSSPLQITISNEQISFLDGGSATAWVNGQMMYIRSLHILESIIIGHHQFIKYDGVQKSTLLKPTGSGEI